MKAARCWFIASFALALCTSGTRGYAQSAAQAGRQSVVEREVSAFCGHVEAVAASQSALLLSPALTLGYLNVPGGAVVSGDVLEARSSAARSRWQAGVAIRPVRMLRGLTTERLARAECERYSALANLPPVAAARASGRAPLEAKIRVLEEAVRRGRELVAGMAQKLEEALATVEDYGALLLQVDGLEQQLAAARLELEALPPPQPGHVAGERLRGIARARAAAARVEELKGELRRSEALDIELRAGYQRVSGAPGSTPLFAMAELQFTPGWLWQGRHERAAVVAASSWVAAQSEGPQVVAGEREQVGRRVELARSRSREVGVTLAELERRRRAVEAAGGEHATRYASLLWLQLAKLRAEQAFLDTTAAELSKLLEGDGGGAP